MIAVSRKTKPEAMRIPASAHEAAVVRLSDEIILNTRQWPRFLVKHGRISGSHRISHRESFIRCNSHLCYTCFDEIVNP